MIYASIMVVVVYFLFAGNSGFVSLWRYKQIDDDLKDDLGEAEQVCDSLQILANKLENDTQFMIKYGREHYNLVRENEKIIRFEPRNETSKDEE